MMGKIGREHKTMVNSQEANSNKFNAQLLDSSHINVNDVGKVIDSRAIQELMNYFYKVTNVGIGITDLKGNILVATGWQDICTKFHRVNPATCRHCIESDTVLSGNGEEGKYILYKCKNHMWDMSTPIKVSGVHIANLFLGQFFFADEDPDYEFFNSLAERCGFDKKEYMDALQRVPRWSREKVNNVMEFYSRFAGMIAKLTYSNEELEKKVKERANELMIINTQLEQEIAERKRTEATLKESEEKFRSLVETTSDLIWEVDENAFYTYVSPRVKDILGYEPQEIMGKTPFDLMPREEAERVASEFLSIVANRRPFPGLENINRHKDGRLIILETSGVPVFDGGGKYRGYRGIDRDITMRKKAEELKDRLLNAISAATEGIAITDDKDRFIYVNDAHARIYGYLQDELIGKTWRDTVTPELETVIEKDLSKTLHNRAVGIWSGECPALRKDGTILPAEITATSRWDETGKYLGHICIARDITERKEAEDKVRQSEIKYRNLFDLSTDGIFILDLDGNFIDVNSTAYTRLGYTKEEMLSLHISKLDHPVFASRVPERLAQIRDHGAAVFESAHLRKDGTAMPVEVNSRLLNYEERQVYFSVIRDITERKIAEEKILAALKEKEILLKEIHHRVKNNLQVVASMLHLQAGYIKDREARTLFEESQKRIESMALLHEKLYQAKDLARIDFREYVVDLASNLLALNTDKSERIEMKVDIEGVILDVNNSIPCGLIINELVSNALAHAFQDGGKGQITIGMHNSSDNRIRLSVSDNGAGFPEDLDFKNTASLGMQLVNSLVNQLDGLIELDRSKGTAFRIEFQA